MAKDMKLARHIVCTRRNGPQGRTPQDHELSVHADQEVHVTETRLEPLRSVVGVDLQTTFGQMPGQPLQIEARQSVEAFEFCQIHRLVLYAIIVRQKYQ